MSVSIKVGQSEVLNAVETSTENMLLHGAPIVSDVDETLIINVAFESPTRLEAVEFAVPNLHNAPDSIKFFVNKALDFSDADYETPTQEFLLRDAYKGGRNMKILLNPLLFQGAHSIAVYIASNVGHGATTALQRFKLFGAMKRGIDLSGGLQSC